MSEGQSNRAYKLSVLALVVSSVISIAGLIYQINRDRRARTSTDARFAKIETVLRMLTGAVAPQLQKAVDDSIAAALAKPNEAKEKLAFAGQVIRQLHQAAASVPPATLAKTSEQLNGIVGVKSDLPQTWTTIGEFISYRSLVLFTGNPQQLTQSNFPYCTDSLPTPTTVDKVIDDTHAVVKRAVYENCRVTLDSEQDGQRVNAALQSGFPFITFKNCLVVYRGGKVNLTLARHTIENQTFSIDGKPEQGRISSAGNSVQFEDCLFDFSLVDIPPPSGREMTQTLLAQNSSAPTLP